MTTTYRHHGTKIVGKFLVRDSARPASIYADPEIISKYSESGGPRRAGLPDPPEITMPSPTTTQRFGGYGNYRVDVPAPSEYRAPSDPPLGLTAEESARINERYWRQAPQLPEAERERRGLAALQSSYDRHWAKQPPGAVLGSPVKDDGLWRTICKLEKPDSMGNYEGSDDDGRNFKLQQTGGGFELLAEVDDPQDVPLQPIAGRVSDRRAQESAELTAFNEKAAALWRRPFR